MSPAANVAQYLADAHRMPSTLESLAFSVGVLAGYVNHPAIYRALGLVPMRRAKPTPPPALPGVVVRRIRVRP